MAVRTRQAWWLIALPLMIGVLPAPASADETAPIVEQKQDVLTPTLQELASGQPSPAKGAVTPFALTDDDPGVPVQKPNGRLLVEVRLANTSDTTLAALRDAGGRVRFVDKEMQTATVAVDPADLKALAASGPAVISVREILRPMTNAACPSGDFVSEGVTQLKATLARSQFSVDGTGVTVGVLSDSYNTLGGAVTDVTNGELPGTTNPCSHTTAVGNLEEGPADGIDEGRAMAQIVHDVAPGARILFASAFNGEAEFAQAIRNLAAAGANVIVDDVTYYLEPMFQDGVIAKAVRDVTAQGVVYLSSAANSNKSITGNRVASYEAPAFRSMACPAAVVTEYGGASITCHDFNSGAGTDALYDMTLNGGPLRYSLGWSEPQNGVATDLDLCLTNASATTVFGCAWDANGVTGIAGEYSGWSSATGGLAWVVVRFAGANTPRLKLISHRSDLTAVQYSTGTGGDIVGPTIFGHNASIPGVTVAAVPYDNSNALEPYSSFGPALYCWQPVTGPTPSGPLTPCQSATVDISATDGGQNSFFGGVEGGFHRFYGTSAAAPHAAGIAALALTGQTCLSPDGAKAALNAGARTVGTAPVDGAGSGLIDATTAVLAGDCQPPRIEVGAAGGWYRTPTATGTAVAKDRRVATLSCTDATGPTGLNTAQASIAWAVSGEGRHTVSCSATDHKGLSATPTSADVQIDSVAPALLCRPAKFPLRTGGTVTADVTDQTSGPASATVSANVATPTVGTFSVNLTGSDVAGNTSTSACSYQVVVVPRMKGPAKASVGAKKTFSVSGLPSKAKVKWTVKLKGKKVTAKKGKAKSSGVAKLKVRFGSKGKYVVTAKSSGTSVRKVVRVR